MSREDFGSTRNRKPDITNLVYGKVPPQAPELEAAVLGAIMLEKEAFILVSGIIPTEECFYADAHQHIYKSMLNLYHKGTPIDLLTVTDQLRKMGKLEVAGGPYALTKLTMDIVSSAHIESHASTVMEKYTQRELIRISGSIIGDAYNDTTDVPELLGRAQKELYEVANHMSGSEPLPLSILMKEVVSESETQKNNKSEITGVPTGYSEFDSMTKGWQKTDFIVLAARPAIGKTAFALNMGFGSAKKGYAGIFFSLEMGGSQLIQRLSANHMNIELDRIRNAGKMTEQEWDIYMKEAGKLAQVPIFIDDQASQTVLQIRSKVFKLLNKGIPLQWVIVDYLGLIQPGVNDKGHNRTQQVSGISRDLKILAKDAKLPVIALCQLNREGDSKPGLTTLRDSGAIEQDADMIVFLYNGTDGDTKDDTVVDIQKYRNGSTAITLMNFNKKYQRFTEKSKNNGFIPINQADKLWDGDGLPFN